MSSRKTGEGGPETVVCRHCEAAHRLPPVEPQVLREPRVNDDAHDAAQMHFKKGHRVITDNAEPLPAHILSTLGICVEPASLFEFLDPGI